MGVNDDITVRVAESADALGIAPVLVDGWQTTYAGILPADFLASFTYDQHEAGTRLHLASVPESSAVFVAVENNHDLVGVAQIRESIESPARCAAELDALYVLPSSQSGGVGTRLFAAVVRWLRERDCHSMSLWVLRDNPHRQFYDRVGGVVLAAEKQDTFGSSTVTSVAYGWHDLEALSAILASRFERPTS
jgi:GNAT superfamily N-acetyltransferase